MARLEHVKESMTASNAFLDLHKECKNWLEGKRRGGNEDQNDNKGKETVQAREVPDSISKEGTVIF